MGSSREGAGRANQACENTENSVTGNNEGPENVAQLRPKLWSLSPHYHGKEERKLHQSTEHNDITVNTGEEACSEPTTATYCL